MWPNRFAAGRIRITGDTDCQQKLLAGHLMPDAVVKSAIARERFECRLWEEAGCKDNAAASKLARCIHVLRTTLKVCPTCLIRTLPTQDSFPGTQVLVVAACTGILHLRIPFEFDCELPKMETNSKHANKLTHP